MRLLIAGVALLAIVAAACGGNDSSTNGTGSQKILRYGYDLSAQFTNTFDVVASNGDCDAIPYSLIYDSLMHWDGTQFTPGLATKMVTSGKTLTLTLRPGLTFQDGEKLDATAVKEGLLQNKKNTKLNSLAPIQTIDTPNPTTVVVNYADTTVGVMAQSMSSRDGMIMAPNSYKTAGKSPVGAGPFKFVSFTPGGSIVLKRWNGYWNKNEYKFDGVTFVQTGTGSPAITALQTGTINLGRLETDGIKPASADPSLQVVTKLSTAYLQLQFRESKTKDKPFDNVKVRQAVNYAIDRNKVNLEVQDGKGLVTDQAYAPGSPGYVASLKDAYPYDPAKAKQLLKDAGFPNGFSFNMAIPGGGIQAMETQAALVQDMLKQVGITAKIVKILGQDISTSYYIQGNGDAFLAARLGSKSPQAPMYDQYGAFQFVAVWNNAENPQITDLVKQSEAATTPAAATQFMEQANTMAINDALEAPIAFQPEALAYTKSKVGGTLVAQTDICDPADLSQLIVK
jgi:peptide/nickel transport system substrate-binding protein